MLQPFIESSTALSDIDDDKPQDLPGFGGQQEWTSSS